MMMGWSRFVSFLAGWWRRHPLLRDALVWAIPAVLFGAGLRLALISYSPSAYWGSDSRSYFGFTDGVWSHFYFSLNEKRRYLYPLFVFAVSLLPGSMLRALALIQAGLGLSAVLPFAYIVRRMFRSWRWQILPLTLLYAGLPIYIWYEHELIADTVLFDSLVWGAGGWLAWISQSEARRGRCLWWWAFFLPLAVAVLTKPSVRFLWPGLVAGLVLVGAWRLLGKSQVLALAGLFVVGLTNGESHQSAWLLYTTVFPLTRLETPLLSDYKGEIRDLVLAKRARLDFYHREDEDVHDFLRDPGGQTTRPLWRAVAKDQPAMNKLYRQLAVEAIAAQPGMFFYIAMTRLAGSANMNDFGSPRFEATFFADSFADQIERKRNPESMVRVAFGLPAWKPLPSVDQFRSWLSPYPNSKVASAMVAYVKWYESFGVMVDHPQGAGTPLVDCRLSILGWLTGLGVLASLWLPYRRSMGVWNVIGLGYLLSVYLVGIEHTRYFAPAWPFVMLNLGMVGEVGICVFRAGVERARGWAA